MTGSQTTSSGAQPHATPPVIVDTCPLVIHYWSYGRQSLRNSSHFVFQIVLGALEGVATEDSLEPYDTDFHT